MSIIQEALKRAEGKVADGNGPVVVERIPERISDVIVASPSKEPAGIQRPVHPTPRMPTKRDLPFSPEQLKMLIVGAAFVCGVMAIGLIALGVTRHGKPAERDVVEVSASSAALPPAVRAAAITEGAVLPSAPIALPSSGAVPTVQPAPLPAPPPADAHLLNGIMYIPESPRAIINNTIVEAGDVIDGATVKKIGPDSVIIVTADGEKTLAIK